MTIINRLIVEMFRAVPLNDERKAGKREDSPPPPIGQHEHEYFSTSVLLARGAVLGFHRMSSCEGLLMTFETFFSVNAQKPENRFIQRTFSSVMANAFRPNF